MNATQQTHCRYKRSAAKQFLFAFALIIVGLLFLPSCAPPPEVVLVCGTATGPFGTLYTKVLAEGPYNEDKRFAGEVQEYSFVLNTDKKVCAVGYMSDSTLKDSLYTIQILEKNGTVLYTGSHVFFILWD